MLARLNSRRLPKLWHLFKSHARTQRGASEQWKHSLNIASCPMHIHGPFHLGANSTPSPPSYSSCSCSSLTSALPCLAGLLGLSQLVFPSPPTMCLHHLNSHFPPHPNLDHQPRNQELAPPNALRQVPDRRNRLQRTSQSNAAGGGGHGASQEKESSKKKSNKWHACHVTRPSPPPPTSWLARGRSVRRWSATYLL